MNPLQKQKLNGLLLGSSCLVASVLLGLSPALAGSAARGLPSGGNVVSGNAKIGGHGSKITQTSEKAFIDWNNFSIGAGETVTIEGPNKNAVTVNRVTGVDRSVIDGVLRANDNVWLLNGNGILFGKGSIINVGSLIATTSDLSDDDFRKGKYRFTTGSNPNASVINKGKITAADGGTVILSAAHVANEGVVKANLGTVVLGGANAFTVDLNGDNLIRYQVTAQVTQAPTDSKGNAQKALVSNSGKIQADGGTVLMTSRAASNVQDNVINNSGMIEATSVSSHNGEVDLDAGTLDARADGYRKSAGTVDDSGQIDVSGTAKGETGGTVTMTGRNVVVADGARIDAQGYAGGGTVLIGGDFHGHGSLKQTKNVTIGKATINADATHNGDGGKVAIWSRGDTSFSGTVNATGGRDGGNGGYVETSGHELSIGDSARIRTLATNGNAGTWLIDPNSVAICNDLSSCCGTFACVSISTSTIQSGLNGGNVEIDAEGSSSSFIIVAEEFDYNSPNTLSFLSQGSIAVWDSVQNSGTGAINLVAGWDGATGLSPGGSGESNTTVNMSAILSTPGAYGNSGGDITIGRAYSCGSVAVGSKGGTLTVDAEDVFVGPPSAGAKANDQLGYDGTGGGNISVNLLGNLTVESANGGTSQIGNGDASQENTGATAITGDIALNVAGTTTIAAEGNNTAWIGNVAYTGGTEAGNVTLVTGVLDVTNCGTASGTLLGSMIHADLGSSNSTGGDFTLGFTNTTGSSITGVNGDTTVSDYFTDGLSYNSPHTLSLFSENDLVLGASIQNSGSGAINLVAGWNGASTSMATILANDDYGASGGDITLGDANSGESVAVGSKGGTLTVAAADLFVGPPNGGQTANFQLGYLGSGGGDIDIVLTGDLDIQSDHGGTSRVGNGGTYYNGAVTGNITINAANINMNQNNAYGGGEAVIGNYGAGAVGGIIGITTSGDVLMSSKNGGGTQVSIGNGSYSDVSTTGNVTLNIGGNLSMYATGYAAGHGGHDGGTYIGSKSATSNINVTVAQNITMTVVPLHGYATHNYVQIGNFGSSASDSQAGGNITVTSTQGNIVMRERSYGGVQIGNTFAHTVSGNIVVTASQGDIDMYSNHGTTQIGNSAYREQVSGNVTVKATQGNIGLYSLGQNAIVEIGNGPAVQTSGDITVTAGGAINLQAEYDYATARIGNNGYGGATSGNIKVTAGGSITLYSNGEFGAGVVAQIGNGGGHMEGKASGNIVVSGGSLSIGSNSVTAYAMIGNGDPLHESKYSSGAYGNISINVTGATVLNGYGETSAWIGNLADGGSTETGAVTLVTKTLGVETDSNADNTALSDMVASDLTGSVTTGTANQGGTGGGNVTIAITGPHTTDWGEYFGDGLQVPNGNTLALITTAAMEVTTTIENTEGGNIDLIAGWDGTTGVTANGINVSRVLSQHAYGASGGDITIGGSDAGGDVAVGTLFGNTTVAGANVTLSGENGYAQIGYNGANSTGNITVDSTGSVTLSSDTAFTQIGNGGAGTNGNNGGNIVVDATGAIVLDFAIGENDAYAQIGNGGLDTNDQAGAAGSNSGNITVTGASVTLTAGGGNNDYAQIGNGGADSNSAAGSNNSGNIKVTTTSGDVTLTGGSQGGSDEQNDYAQIGMGGPFSGASNTKDTGNITVNSAAGVTLMGGTDADQQNGFAVIGDTGTAKKTGDITVTAGGDITVRGGSATGNPNFTGAANSFAQIGDTNSGVITGNLTVTAGGSLTIRGGNGDAGDTAWVGNTSSDSNVIGNVSIAVDGTTIIDSYQSADQAGFGNTASGATATGTTLLNTNDLALGSDSYADFGKSLASSLDNGNVTVEIEDENADTAIAGAVFYDSANTLKILDRGSLHLESNIQNSGTGAIYVVGGWDGTTTNASNFANAGVYGNNGGSITVGDVVGNVSIGSKSGTTTFAADNIDVDAEIGIAQIGWSGIGGGNISVVANGNVTLETAANAECSDCTALIGNGGTSVDGTVTGNISVVTTGGSVSVSALGGYSSVSSIATIGNIGDQASMRGNVAIDTNGGDVTLVSSGTNSYAQIGSWSTEFGDPGSITSNITVDAGAVSLTANGSGSSADIGNGNYLGKSVNGAITGNITIDATTLSVVTDSSNTDYEEARVGNLGGGVVTGTLDVTTTGNVLVSGSGPGAASIGNFSSEYDNDIGGYDQGEATGTVEVTSGGSITVESNDGYASIELGGAKSGTVDVTAKKNITETATNGGGVLIGSLAIDNGGVNVSVTSKTGNIDLESSGADSTTQIGTLQDSQDAGGDTSGNVSITATQGNITVAANNGGATQLGNIGDTDTGDFVSGNLTLTAGDVFDIATTGTTIGNTGGLESGNVAIKAATLQGDISPSIENDLPGGNFNLALTGDDTLTLSTDIDYNSAHNLTLSNGGDIVFDASVQNSGSGNITVDSGDTVTIGGAGATGDVEVGSLTGTTTVTAGSLVISGKNGDAALGYADQSGHVILTAGSVSASGHAEIVGLTADITVDAGNFGSAAHPVELLVGALALNSAGGSAYITAPNSISIGVGSDGIDLDGGDLILSSDGAVTQTQAITASSIDISGVSIALTNAGNSFGDATLSSSGNAKLHDASDLTIDSADVGGTLTLSGGGNIGQSGAIAANALNVTAGNGAITLTNTANSFGDATLTASGNASLYDAADLTVDGANVGGTLTLAGGGNIGQSGAITASTLDVTANHGKITLTNTGNAFADADLTASGNASLYDASALTVTGADVGGTLTLTGGGNIGQSGAITASTLDVTANHGKITLTNTGNAFADADLTASGNASLYDAADLTVDGADVGGTLTLAGGGNIGQSGAITAGALDVTANHGTITLANTGNAFADADLTASGNASLYDASALTITGADVGGTLTLTGGGNIGQSGAIVANALKATASNGSITLANSGNSFGDATLAASGNASLYDAADLTIDSADVGGTLTLSGGGNIGQSGAITAASLNVTASNGAIALTNTANSFADATLTASGNAALDDSADLTIDGANVGGTLTLTGAGNIGQSGAIVAGTLDVVANHGVIALTNTGNSIGDADLTSSGNASLYDASDLIIDGANVGGKLTLSGGGNIGQSGAIDAGTLSVTAKHGSIALTDADNDVTTASLSAHGDVALYDSVDLTVKSADAGGNLTLLTQGNLTFVSSVQLQNGDLLAVAGWDGTTTNPSALATRGAYGNNGGSITVGGKNAAGNVAIGSANGSTTLAAANVTLDGENGYAQIGYHGAGSGDIDVVASRDVTLTGGTGAGDYAQIGNGGMGTSGDESGNITVDAVGAVALDGGDGKDAYAQIGHGGADADKNSHGYTNSGTIDVKGQTVALLAGAGDESYAQIGHGGFDLGDGLTGQGVNSGNITITAVDGVSLTGNGTDAYTQIGNGGDQVNANAGSSAGGSNSGDIVVAAGAGISMIAGASEDAYAQIGNGGFGTNASGDADPSNFTDSGTITVSDLVLTGSDTGKDAYAQIGNGDASGTGIGDVSGNITIDAGSITVHSGSAAGANAAIANATGKGTVSGTVAGYTAPSTNNNSTQGVVTSIVSQTSQANVQQVSLVVVNPPENQQTSIISDTGTSEETGPLGRLSGDKEGSGNEASDDATDALGQSLGGHRHNVQTVALIPGVLTEVVNTQTAHGIPPADQNFSSWGNEALWRW